MAKLNRVCCVCKQQYKYCPTCAVDAKKPTWMAVFCCENCKNLYDVINDYRYGKISKEEALNKLNTLDLSSTDDLPENFKKMLNEILAVKEQVEVLVEETTKSVVLAYEVKEENTEEISVEKIDIEKPVVQQSEETPVHNEEVLLNEVIEKAVEMVEEKEIKKPRKRKAYNIEG